MSITVATSEMRSNHLGVYKQPYSPCHLCDCKSCMCMPNWLNNLEPVTLHQETEGAARSDYSRFHLPQLYIRQQHARARFARIHSHTILFVEYHHTHNSSHYTTAGRPTSSLYLLVRLAVQLSLPGMSSTIPPGALAL